MHRKDTAIVLSGVGADRIRPLFRLAARATFPEGEGFCPKNHPRDISQGGVAYFAERSTLLLRMDMAGTCAGSCMVNAI